MSRPKFHALKVKQIRRETAECVSVAFEVPADLEEVYKFIPGQYLTLRTTIGGEDMRRSYSICSAPSDGELRVAVKEVDHGVFSHFVNKRLKAGDELQVMTPTGNFTTEIGPDIKRNYLFVAAGSGITPVMSLIKTVLTTSPESEVCLVYGNRHFRSIIFRDELENLKDRYLGRFRIFHILSGEPNEIPLFHGRINHEKIELLSKSFINFQHIDRVFVCGPGEMIHTVKELAPQLGVAAENVHFELFVTPGKEAHLEQPTHKKFEHAVSGEKVCSVSVIYDGQQTNFQLPFNGMPVLDAAQKQGLDIPFSCKGGMCCTCKAKVLDGEVEMEVNYALEPGEVEAGFVLTCQSHPRSEKLVIDFDANT